MFNFIDNFVEVTWSMEVEADAEWSSDFLEAEEEAKRHHFHINGKMPNFLCIL